LLWSVVSRLSSHSFPTRRSSDLYLGSSFAFIAPITASTQAESMGAALGGVMLTGLLLAALGLLVQKVGTAWIGVLMPPVVMGSIDRKSTRLNSSHVSISYAVFCL